MDDKEKELLQKLYELSFGDESEHIQLEQKTLALFTSMILATVGGILFVLKDIHDFFVQELTLFTGGILVIILSILAIKAFHSNYRRHLEAIATRAKLEDLLEFNSEKYRGKIYWLNESLLLTRYVKDRCKYKNSEDFVKDRVNKGFAVIVKNIFFSFSLIGSLFVLIGIIKLCK
jgi:hypothetical protein